MIGSIVRVVVFSVVVVLAVVIVVTLLVHGIVAVVVLVLAVVVGVATISFIDNVGGAAVVVVVDGITSSSDCGCTSNNTSSFHSRGTPALLTTTVALNWAMYWCRPTSVCWGWSMLSRSCLLRSGWSLSRCLCRPWPWSISLLRSSHLSHLHPLVRGRLSSDDWAIGRNGSWLCDWLIGRSPLDRLLARTTGGGTLRTRSWACLGGGLLWWLTGKDCC